MTNMEKIRIEKMKIVFGLLLNNIPTDDMILNYINEVSEELQAFCVNNLKPEIDWSTGIGIIDAANAIYFEAWANCNIKD